MWFRFWMVILGILFAWGLSEAHGTHLSDLPMPQTKISMFICLTDGGYAVQSEESGCYFLYKHIGFDHADLHVEPLTLDEDGVCSCPSTRGN